MEARARFLGTFSGLASKGLVAVGMEASSIVDTLTSLLSTSERELQVDCHNDG
jgi:hypothetical protein